MKRRRNKIILILTIAVVIFLLASCMESAEIIGSVRDTNGNGIEDATVKLLQGSTVLQITKTDPGGDYVFSGVKQGTYKVEAFKEGYEDKLSDFFSVTFGTTHAPQLILQNNADLPKHNIYGVVSLADREKGNWEEITVALLQGSETIRVATTDASGTFEIKDVPEGNYILRCEKSGYQTREENINLNDDISVNIQLIPSSVPGTVEGLVAAGKLALYHNNMSYAEYNFKLAYQQDPDNIDANFGYALTYGSTELEAAFNSVAAAGAVSKLLKKTPLTKFLQPDKSLDEVNTETFRALFIDILNKRENAMNFVKNHAAPTYLFDIDDDEGKVFISFGNAEILFYYGLLQSLSGVPEFIIDHFDLNIDIDRLENAFHSDDGLKSLDSNNDGILTPEEFFGSEFLKLREGEDINALDYSAALSLTSNGMANMLLGLGITPSSTNQLFAKIDTDDKAKLISALTAAKSATMGPVSIEIKKWNGETTTLKINVPALFNNDNKIDDWKKLMPSLTLISVSSDFFEDEDGDDSSSELPKEIFKKILNSYGDEPGDYEPTFLVLPDLLSKHAYDFNAGKDWLFGSDGFFPNASNQYDVLELILPPEIYGTLKDKDDNAVNGGMAFVGLKNKVDEQIAEEDVPQFDEIGVMTTYISGYYAIPLISTEKATDIYLVGIKSTNPFSPPATGDLVGIYSTDEDYGGITEIATPGTLFRVLSYRKAIDTAYLTTNSTDEKADMKLIELGFSINIPDNYNEINGSVKCYINSTPTSTKVLISLFNLTQGGELCDATDTSEDGYYKITNFNINEGDLCEIDALYINDDGTTEEGSFTFIYHGGVADLGLITIYPTSIGLNSLHVNWNINCDPNTVDRIWPVIQDTTTGDIYYKTARWGDDYAFKLPAGTYNVWIEYIDLSEDPPEVKTTNTTSVDFTTTGKSTEITIDIP